MNGEGNSSQWNHWMSNFQGLFSSNTVHLSNTANDNGSSRATRVTSNGSSSSIVTSAIVSPDESLKFNSTQMAILAPGQLSNAVDDDETRWLHEDTIDANSAKWSIYKGLIYSSLSSLCFSLCAAIVKYLRVSIFYRKYLNLLMFYRIFIPVNWLSSDFLEFSSFLFHWFTITVMNHSGHQVYDIFYSCEGSQEPLPCFYDSLLSVTCQSRMHPLSSSLSLFSFLSLPAYFWTNPVEFSKFQSLC